MSTSAQTEAAGPTVPAGPTGPAGPAKVARPAGTRPPRPALAVVTVAALLVGATTATATATATTAATAATTAKAATAATAAAVRAAEPPSVPIPQHPVSVGLTLVGASEAGIAVQQAPVEGGARGDDPPRVYTGAEGTELTLRRALLATSSAEPGVPLAVVGRTLAWHLPRLRAGTQSAEAHRLDLLSGDDDVSDGFIAVPDAFDGSSWFSHEPPVVSDLPNRWNRSLRQIRVATRRHPASTEVLVPDVPGVVGVTMAAGGGSVLWATSRRADDGATRFALDLVDVSTRAVERVTESADPVTAVAMSPDTLVWVTAPEGGPRVVHRRPRGGGATVEHVEPDADADLAHVAVGGAGVGYLVHDPDNPYGGVLRVLEGDGHRDVALPWGGSGLAVVGDRFFTAVGGPFSAVYAVRGDTVTQVATVPEPSRPTRAWSLSAGRLRYSHASDDGQGDEVFERRVSGGARARFSGETPLPRTAGALAFSAGRGVVAAPDRPGTWRLLDRGEVLAEVEALGAPNVSGPYTLVGGRVFRPDGELAYEEPMGDGESAGADDLFGSRVVFVRVTAAGVARIMMDDVERPGAVELARVEGACGSPAAVSVWGSTVAWGSGCEAGVSVRDLRTGSTRVLASAWASPSMSLSEGTLAWSEREVDQVATNFVADLGRTVLSPVELPGMGTMLAVDDHRVARDVRPFYSPVPNLRLSPLPFDRPLPPRLIGAYAPLGFSPDGDGRGDRWTPQFDVTKPLRSATLTVTDHAGRTVATLGGIAPDGSIRDLSWNGLSSRGQQLPGGVYHWRLTGRADDGDGALVGTDGDGPPAGTVELALHP